MSEKAYETLGTPGKAEQSILGESEENFQSKGETWKNQQFI